MSNVHVQCTLYSILYSCDRGNWVVYILPPGPETNIYSGISTLLSSSSPTSGAVVLVPWAVVLFPGAVVPVPGAIVPVTGAIVPVTGAVVLVPWAVVFRPGAVVVPVAGT